MQLKRHDLLVEACLIHGQWVSAAEAAVSSLAVNNPVDQSVVGHVPLLDEAWTLKAIDSAHTAYQSWKTTTGEHRAQALRRWFDLMIAHRDDLAMLLTYEQGKPLAEAAGEITYAASYIEWFAEEAKRTYGDVIPATQADKRIMVIKQPIGVVAAITPWNFPIAMITRKAAAALAAGCTIVIRPASETPFSALAAAKLALEAGIPAGVINVVTGASHVVAKTLVDSPIVRKLTFTGSTPVGRTLMQQSAATLKKLSLELGGNAPFIVFEDADIDAAVKGAMVSKFRNAGQTCVCANRFYVHRSVAAEFVEKFKQAMQALVLGKGWESGVHIGPLINAKAVQYCLSMIEDAEQKGAEIALGGRVDEHLGGLFFQPTLLTQVPQHALAVQQEIFGPIAPIILFDTESEVIEYANDTEFGLASYIYTQNIHRIFRVSEALEYGMVGVNEGLISTAVAPFGGIKASGFGREGSKYGIDDYMEKKYICMGGF